jgi:hypothetical protein
MAWPRRNTRSCSAKRRVEPLPRFYLNIVRHGVFIADPEGDEVADLEAACQLAFDTLRDMHRLPNIYGEPQEWENREFVITDEGGTPLARIPYNSALDGP